MHIVYVSREYIPSRRGGGIATYLKEVAECLVAMGHQVTVVAASDDTRKEYVETLNGVKIIRLRGGDFVIPTVEQPFFFRRFRSLYRFNAYRKRVKEAVVALKDIDIIEVADFGAEALHLTNVGVPLTIRLHTPSLFDRATEGVCRMKLRNCWNYHNQKKELQLLTGCQHITSCSESLKKWTINNLKVNESNIRVIPNPVNFQAFSANKEAKCPLDETATNLVFVGTICDSKGCEELADAAKMLKSQFPQLHLWFFGKRGIWAERLAQSNRECEWMHFYGKVDRVLLYAICKQADLVCLPSWWDNLPMTCIEAMMAGGLVLGSSSGGMAEMLDDGRTGFLVQPKDSARLAKKMTGILSKPQNERLAIRQATQKTAIATYSTEVVVRQLLDYYQSVINDYHTAK